MLGIKYIFNSLKRKRVIMLIGSLFGIAVSVFSFVFHEELGSEDYIYPKAFLAFTAWFFVTLTVINGCCDLSQNKLVPSLPIARELYTKSMPTFISVVSAAITAVFIGAYFLFLGIIGAESVQFADTLIIFGTVCGTFLLGSPIIMRFSLNGIAVLYISVIPVSAVIILTGAKSNGFGLPIWAGAAIFAVALIAGTVWTFIFSRILYRRRSIKVRFTVDS
ncbi:MAG: hypothetical protein HDT42_09665 [Ruminococcaceae bacterium]|nr:hypothetical protein [Oscillospiraceae bacterium]